MERVVERIALVVVVAFGLGVVAWVIAAFVSEGGLESGSRRLEWRWRKMMGHTRHHPSQLPLRMMCDGVIVLAMERQSPGQSDAEALEALQLEPVGWTPAQTCGVKGPCAANAALWAHPTWKALRFAPRAWCQYALERREGGGWRARARCDRDGDGVFAEFARDVVASDTMMRCVQVPQGDEAVLYYE